MYYVLKVLRISGPKLHIDKASKKKRNICAFK